VSGPWIAALLVTAWVAGLMCIAAVRDACRAHREAVDQAQAQHEADVEQFRVDIAFIAIAQHYDEEPTP